MSMRITNGMSTRSLLADLNDIATKQDATRRKMSSGKEITRPSDDPYGAGRALSLRTELEGIRQYQRNAREANGWMTVTDTALSHITDLAQRARELVVQGATGTASQNDRNAMASEIDQIIAGVKQEGNATYDGRYVLAGDKTDAAPYDSTLSKTPPPSLPPFAPNDGYQGGTEAHTREIGPGVRLQVNVTGNEVLGDSNPPATPGMLSVLRDVAAHLRAGDGNALQADLGAIDTQFNTLLGVRARIGAGMNRVETAQSRLAELEESSTSMLSSVEDADMAKTLVDFSTQQAVYQSALNAGARVVQTSLMDFLR